MRKAWLCAPMVEHFPAMILARRFFSLLRLTGLSQFIKAIFQSYFEQCDSVDSIGRFLHFPKDLVVEAIFVIGGGRERLALPIGSARRSTNDPSTQVAQSLELHGISFLRALSSLDFLDSSTPVKLHRLISLFG